MRPHAGGSVRIPASYCGLVGFKPTFGAIPRAGVKSLAESLDTVGGFARSVPDAALFASVMMRDPRLLDLSNAFNFEADGSVTTGKPNFSASFIARRALR